jgi:hypothetical protein
LIVPLTGFKEKIGGFDEDEDEDEVNSKIQISG